MAMGFETRHDAGSLLAVELQAYTGSDALVLGLTRGGVVVGHAVATALRLPFDILVIHPIDGPGAAQWQVAVVAEPDHLVVHENRVRELGLPPGWLADATTHSLGDLRRRATAYRQTRPRQTLAGRPVIVVDDSAATGATLHAAVRAVRAAGPRAIVIAVPVAPLPVIETLRPQVQQLVCLATPAELIRDEVYYPPPGTVPDDEIRRLLQTGAGEPVMAGRRSPPAQRHLIAGAHTQKEG